MNFKRLAALICIFFLVSVLGCVKSSLITYWKNRFATTVVEFGNNSKVISLR
jgi:hypothetical protein